MRSRRESFAQAMASVGTSASLAPSSRHQTNHNNTNDTKKTRTASTASPRPGAISMHRGQMNNSKNQNIYYSNGSRGNTANGHRQSGGSFQSNRGPPKNTNNKSGQQQQLGDGHIQKQCFRTKMCAFFNEGKCNKGASCSFAHHREQLKARPDFKKTRLCVTFNQGKCPRDASECPFAHGEEDLRHDEGPKSSWDDLTQSNSLKAHRYPAEEDLSTDASPGLGTNYSGRGQDSMTTNMLDLQNHHQSAHLIHQLGGPFQPSDDARHYNIPDLVLITDASQSPAADRINDGFESNFHSHKQPIGDYGHHHSNNAIGHGSRHVGLPTGVPHVSNVPVLSPGFPVNSMRMSSDLLHAVSGDHLTDHHKHSPRLRANSAMMIAMAAPSNGHGPTGEVGPRFDHMGPPGGIFLPHNHYFNHPLTTGTPMVLGQVDSRYNSLSSDPEDHNHTHIGPFDAKRVRTLSGPGAGLYKPSVDLGSLEPPGNTSISTSGSDRTRDGNEMGHAQKNSHLTKLDSMWPSPRLTNRRYSIPPGMPPPQAPPVPVDSLQPQLSRDIGITDLRSVSSTAMRRPSNIPSVNYRHPSVDSTTAGGIASLLQAGGESPSMMDGGSFVSPARNGADEGWHDVLYSPNIDTTNMGVVSACASPNFSSQFPVGVGLQAHYSFEPPAPSHPLGFVPAQHTDFYLAHHQHHPHSNPNKSMYQGHLQHRLDRPGKTVGDGIGGLSSASKNGGLVTAQRNFGEPLLVPPALAGRVPAPQLMTRGGLEYDRLHGRSRSTSGPGP